MKNKLLFKRICSVFAAVSLCMIPTAAPVSADEVSTGSLSLLKELNIMTGDPDGNMRLYDTITRAEFTKAAVASSNYKNSVAVNLAISPFYDVTYMHWSAPYVRVGVTAGLVSGYPDSSFKPDNDVLYEEALTIMLRVLGYTDEDFGASWPYGQIGLANNLEITKGIDCSAGQVMNRGQVAQLIYNSLKTKQKDKSSQLASVFDTEIKEDVTLIADNSDDSSIATDEVYTNGGTYKKGSSFSDDDIGLSGDAAIKNGNKLIAFVPDSSNSETDSYVIYSALSDSIMAYHGSSLTQLEIADNTTVYRGKGQTTFSAVKSGLQLGDIFKIKKTDGKIDYITWQDGNVLGPVTISASGWSTNWNTNDDTKVMRDGTASSKEQLKTYDVAYYLPDLNMVLSYSDKITGVYQSASPNKDMPQSVTISGKEYTLEGGAAFSKLASGGSFEFGDTITALIGKNGSIADVITPGADMSGSVVGYLAGTGRKEFQSGSVDSYTSYYVNIALPGGKTEEYVTNIDYSEGINKIVEVSFENGYAKCSVINGSPSLSGNFSWASKRLGSKILATDLAILDVGTQDSTYTGVYTSVFPQRLEGVALSSSQILYFSTNSNGEVNKLILNDVTGDAYSYGFMCTAKQNSASLSGTYKYVVNGQMYNLSTNGKLLNAVSGTAIKISGTPSKPNYVSKLNEVSGRITSVTSDKLITSDKSYLLSADVSVYQKNYSLTDTYTKIPVSDIIGKTDLKLSAFYDKAEENGGRIRVIVLY